MRMLGIDFGTKRVGLAVCDELHITVAPHGTLRYSRDVVEQIAQLVESERIGQVVVGVPVPHDRIDTLAMRQARNFAARLRARLRCPVDEWDESFTSRQAVERMVKVGVPKKRRRIKETTDSWAAAIILEDYMARMKDEG